MQNQLEDSVYTGQGVQETVATAVKNTEYTGLAYAGFAVRFVAFIVDSIIAAIAVGIVKLPLSILAGAGATFLTANFLFQYSFLDVLSYIGIAAYFVLLTYFAHATLGKMLFRIEVVTEQEEWTFLNVLYRETVGRFLSSLLCIGYFAVIVTEKKQGFHDMLCDTRVVYAKMKECKGNLRKNKRMAAKGTNMPKSVVQEATVPITMSHDHINPDCSVLKSMEDK